MHVFSAAKAWSLLFAPRCWFIILYSYSRVEIQEDTLYTFFSLISDDLNGSFFCRCVRPRAFCDFLSLSTAPSPEKRGEKIRHAFEEMDDRSPRYAFNQQRVLRKGRRTEKKSISFSTVPTTGEFVIINTRFFCVAFLGRRFDSIRVRAKRDSPLLVCFVLQSTTEERKFFWADEFGRKKPNQSTFFAKTYDYTRAHFCSPHFVRRGVEDLRRYASECEITRTTGTNTLHLFRSFFFGRWRCLGRVLERESALWFSIASVF